MEFLRLSIVRMSSFAFCFYDGADVSSFMIYIRTHTDGLSTGARITVRNAHADEKLIRHYAAGHNRGIKRRGRR
jgi:hypothetical protein